MAHRVLSLKYRPQNFDQLAGQKHVVLSLKGALKSGRIGHAFLFAGPRGVGKTTTARILAKSLNCVEGPTVLPCQECQSCKEITHSRSIDVVEIDGASNRGIEEIRNLREGVKYSPLHGRYKIYIIDEVHMLTQEAFNALLKTLEEPPPKVVFMFATTNPSKIPPTILSRCQRFVFKRLTVAEISARLRLIADKENIRVSKNALHYIAVRADGSIRDGESILEQLASFVEGEITEQDVFKLTGFLGSTFYFDLLAKITAKDIRQVFLSLNKALEDGAEPVEIYKGITFYLRAALLLHADIQGEVLELNSEETTALNKLSLSEEKIIKMLELMLESEDTIKRSMNVRIALELLFSRLIISLQGSAQEETKNQKCRNTSPSSKNKKVSSIKDLLIAGLQKNNPQLAGIIHKAKVIRHESTIEVIVDSEFSLRRLEANKKRLSAIVKNMMQENLTISIKQETKQTGENNLINTIKVLFDGEEVRQ